MRFKKHGIYWSIGELAEFRINNVEMQEKLRKQFNKIRVMMPVDKFSAFNNSSKYINERMSSSSSGSNGSRLSSGLDNFIVVENPVFLDDVYSNPLQGITIRDECYTSVMGSKVTKYDPSLI